jgi:hypothetical protein
VNAAERREKDRARKRSYGRPCLDCGTITDVSNGRAKAPLRCAKCTPIAARIWTHDTIINAIQLYAHRYGHPPSATDWNPAHARAVGRDDWADRFYKDGDYPYVPIVQGRFGTWNAAIAAAGFTPRGRGEHGPDRPRA